MEHGNEKVSKRPLMTLRSKVTQAKRSQINRQLLEKVEAKLEDPSLRQETFISKT